MSFHRRSFAQPRRQWLAIAALALALAACTQDKSFRTSELPPDADWGGDFVLTAHDGRRVNSADFRGQVQLIFFGYTHCPDICSPTLAKLATLLRDLGPQAERVQVLFVTVDPAHDTPAQLAGFVPRFHLAILGLTGTNEEIAAVTRAYRVGFQPAAGGDGSIAHAGGIFIRDAGGRLRLYAKEGVAPQDLLHDVRRLLKETGR
jgi:protein SCO1/2